MSSLQATDLRQRGIRQASLPPWAIAATTVGAIFLTLLLFAVTGFAGQADFVVVAAVLIVVAIGAASWVVEGRRRAIDRIATNAALGALVLTLLPLGFVITYVVKKGAPAFSLGFLTHEATAGPLAAGGGIAPAILGTLEQVAIASAFAVPLALLVAIYITEYGGNKFATSVRFLIDVMTGIPSIVAGLFVLAFWITALRQPLSGFAGAMALAIIELPIVVRTSEEMIRLVPNELREASYALGIPKWKTVVRVVLPVASTGLTTGVMLAVARAIGETAPVLLVVGFNNYTNLNPFGGNQASLPGYIFQFARSSSNFDVQRAWAAALALILLVVVLYVAARLLTRRNQLAGR
ncbi:MAG TPA: phosphate ABC transporter permease PstA [Mycobacteriales bacterium]|jgi:phosphate transport system permease protein|nr:phosphate ABC transporter permease PstA [Mycobacteriales bacterium]